MHFLAVDWGTTNRRVFLIEDGVVSATERDDRGAATIAAGGFEAEVAAIRARFGALPMLLAGMVGSNVGWQDVPYVAAPADLAALAAGMLWIDAQTAIVPGIACGDGAHADVMRGEEVQLLGAFAAGLVPADALLCQPGTHCKWANLSDGAITSFTTAMTGELFGLLRSHGLLARQLGGDAVPGAAFEAGVAEGKRRDLAASLFGIRARGRAGSRRRSGRGILCQRPADRSRCRRTDRRWRDRPCPRRSGARRSLCRRDRATRRYRPPHR